MEITWQVEDGYAGGTRPQYTEIDDQDIRDCETIDEAMDLIEQVVQDDFSQKVSWCLLGDARVKVERILGEKKDG